MSKKLPPKFTVISNENYNKLELPPAVTVMESDPPEKTIIQLMLLANTIKQTYLTIEEADDLDNSIVAELQAGTSPFDVYVGLVDWDAEMQVSFEAEVDRDEKYRALHPEDSDDVILDHVRGIMDHIAYNFLGPVSKGNLEEAIADALEAEADPLELFMDLVSKQMNLQDEKINDPDWVKYK